MICLSKKGFLSVLYALFLVAGSGVAAITEQSFHGAADVSAGVFMDSEHFVIADDESNVLLIYKTGQADKPVATLNLNDFLAVEADSPEADIEAAAKVDDRIYWITSHGRNKNGKFRPNRYRFFCTRIVQSKGASATPKLVPVGVAYKGLVQDMLKHPSVVRQSLYEATRIGETLSKKELKKLAPKKDGLNIEGLTYYPPNKSLLIGFRNPLFMADRKAGSRAIVIELKNPAEVIDKQKNAEFGQVLLWDLNGRSIRGIEYSQRHKQYFILAGGAVPALYCWDGDLKSAPRELYQWPKSDPRFTPEGVSVAPETGLLWVFSDDGTVEINVESPAECMDGQLLLNGNCLNKHLRDSGRKKFRVRKMNPLELLKK